MLDERVYSDAGRTVGGIEYIKWGGKNGWVLSNYRKERNRPEVNGRTVGTNWYFL